MLARGLLGEVGARSVDGAEDKAGEAGGGGVGFEGGADLLLGRGCDGHVCCELVAGSGDVFW